MRCSECSRIVKPIVAVDIDGTLGDYHAHFHRYAEEYLGKLLPATYRGAGKFRDALGLEQHVYQEIKLAYRQGGMKRNMPVLGPASTFVRNLREAGAEIWITTTRPFMRLDNIDPDTKEWLRRTDIEYDGLLYDEDKYRRLLELVDKGRVVAVVDDLPKMLEAAHDLDLHAINRWTRWNAAVTQHPGSDQLSEISAMILDRISEWKATARV